MNEQNKNEQPTANSSSTDVNAVSTSASDAAPSPAPATPVESGATAPERAKWPFYIAAVVVVVALLLGVLYMLEKDGRSETQVFTWLIEAQQANAVVAVVNGTEITGKELEASVEQFTQVAAAQGVDVNDPAAQAEIRTQALEVLVNTELLKQAAGEAGLSISTDEASERLDEITADLGGEEVLTERMASLGVDRSSLLEDIQDELLIDRYLSGLFADEDTTPSEEEVVAFYESAGGVEGGLPPLEEVRGQIEQQLTATTEQALIDGVLTDLRADADIVIEEEVE